MKPNKNRMSIFLLSLSAASLLVGCETKEPITCILPATGGTSNSPVIVDGNIELSTPDYGNATYQWTGPNGFVSTDQNPTILHATASMSGQYTLKVMKGICETPVVALNVDVVASPVTCNQANNTVTIGTFGTFNLNSVYTSSNSGNFEIRAGGPQSDITIRFAESVTVPPTAVYTICHDCSDSEIGPNEVRVETVALGGEWMVAQSGQVVVSYVSGHISAIFCEVPFSGTYHPNISAKMTDN